MSPTDNAKAPADLVALDTHHEGPNTANDFLWTAGQNMSNHSAAQAGRARFVAPARNLASNPMLFRYKQDAFRCAAWLIELADAFLPDDPESVYSYEEIREAIRTI